MLRENSEVPEAMIYVRGSVLGNHIIELIVRAFPLIWD
jgi:hypothetical protein